MTRNELLQEQTEGTERLRTEEPAGKFTTKMKTITLLWSVVSVLTAGLAAGALGNGGGPGQGPEPAPAQVIRLEDGTKLTLLGVTYGPHHVAPNYEAIGGKRRNGVWFDDRSNTTVVWVEAEHDPRRSP